MSIPIVLLVTFLVTYVPRVIPLLLIRKPIKSRFIKSFIYYVPAAVLAMLALPAIFYSTGNFNSAAITAAIVFALSFTKIPAEATIVISVVIALILNIFV